MVHSVGGWTRGVQVKPWDPLRTRAIPERLRGVITTRRYTNPRLPYLTLTPYYVKKRCTNYPTRPRRHETYRQKDRQWLENATADVVSISPPERHLGNARRRRSELALTVRQQPAARSRHRRSHSGGRPRPPGSETAACRLRLRVDRGTACSRCSRLCACRSAV